MCHTGAVSQTELKSSPRLTQKFGCFNQKQLSLSTSVRLFGLKMHTVKFIVKNDFQPSPDLR